MLWTRTGFSADSNPGPSFISMRIRIQAAKPMRIHPDPDPGQTLKSQKVKFLHEKLYFTVIGQKTFIRTVLQIRDVDPGSEVFHLGSRA